MKIELKHLIPYLLYGVKYASNVSLQYMREEWEITGELSHRYTFNDRNMIDELIKGKDIVNTPIKIVLRPLSDLSDEIIEVLKYDGIEEPIKDFEYLGVKSYTHCFTMDGKEVGILALPYYVINKLFKHHFDVFGLIDKGLAIDKNTLNKPTKD